jgi:hypothetical protein
MRLCLSAILCVCADGFKLPVWGEGGQGVDIAVAYEKAAAAVLGQRAQYLIFAQGLMAARDLRAVAKRPLVLRTSYPNGPVVKNQLVYEVRLCLPCLLLIVVLPARSFRLHAVTMRTTVRRYAEQAATCVCCMERPHRTAGMQLLKRLCNVIMTRVMS